MEQSIKTFIKWVLIYGIAFGFLTALFDYFDKESIFIPKNMIGGLIFGSVMAYLKLKSDKSHSENKN